MPNDPSNAKADGEQCVVALPSPTIAKPVAVRGLAFKTGMSFRPELFRLIELAAAADRRSKSNWVAVAVERELARQGYLPETKPEEAAS